MTARHNKTFRLKGNSNHIFKVFVFSVLDVCINIVMICLLLSDVKNLLLRLRVSLPI